MTAARHGYLICAMPRSGSYYLCDLLTSTGVLGRPTEYLNPDALESLAIPALRDDPRARLRQALELGVTSNGIYGLKVLSYHFDHYTYPGWMHDLPRPAFVFIGRDDLLSQALSFAKALQTGKWTSTTPAHKTRAVYDEVLIRRCLNDLVLDEARWRSFFGRNDLRPLRLSYESLTQAPQVAIDAIAGLVGVDGDVCVNPDKLTLQIQRDDEARIWRERFLSANADLGYLDSNRIAANARFGSLAARNRPDVRADEKVVVWGAGKEARTIVAQRFDLASIDFFIDSDERKQGGTFLGLPVRAPEALFDEQSCLVIVGSPAFETNIRQEIAQRFDAHVREVVTFDQLLLDPRYAAAPV